MLILTLLCIRRERGKPDESAEWSNFQKLTYTECLGGKTLHQCPSSPKYGIHGEFISRLLAHQWLLESNCQLTILIINASHKTEPLMYNMHWIGLTKPCLLLRMFSSRCVIDPSTLSVPSDSSLWWIAGKTCNFGWTFTLKDKGHTIKLTRRNLMIIL